MADSKISVAELRRLLDAAHRAGNPPWPLPYNAERLEYLVALRNAAPALLRAVKAMEHRRQVDRCPRSHVDEDCAACREFDEALDAFDHGENDD